MNKLTIIGCLCADPELRSTPDGVSVCDFRVAVNRKKTRNNQDPGADFFRVTVWREKGENCAKYLSKGKKVCVVGTVSARAYTTNKGEPAASLEVTAEEVEFLSQKTDNDQPEVKKDERTGFQQVETDDLPF